MFDFLRKPGMRTPSAALRRALEANSLPAGADVAELGVVESRGSYAGRPVTYIRVFDPASAVRRSVDVYSRQAYKDFNAHLDLVLRAGFVEQDGRVVLYAQPAASTAAAGSGETAERGARADHAQVISRRAGS